MILKGLIQVLIILISADYSVESCGSFNFQMRHPRHKAFKVHSVAMFATDTSIQETSTTSSITSDLLSTASTDEIRKTSTVTTSTVTASTNTILAEFLLLTTILWVLGMAESSSPSLSRKRNSHKTCRI